MFRFVALVFLLLYSICVFSSALSYAGVKATSQNRYDLVSAPLSGEAIYAVDNVAGILDSYLVRESDGSLQPSQTSLVLPSLIGAVALEFSRNENFILVSSTATGLHAFHRESGEAGFETINFQMGGAAPTTNILSDVKANHAIFSRDGKSIYVVGTQDNGGSDEGVIVMLTGVVLNAESKLITIQGEKRIAETSIQGGRPPVPSLKRPVKIAISKTAATKDVYVISNPSAPALDAFIHFKRSEASGDLSFNVAIENNEQTGVDKVNDLVDIQVSTIPEFGNNVYVAASSENSILQFSQADSSPAPYFSKIYSESGGKFQGLKNVKAITLSGNTGILYAASKELDQISQFIVESDGIEEFSALDEIKNKSLVSNGVEIDGLDEVNLLIIAGKAKYLYAGTSISPNDNASSGFAAFSRISDLKMTINPLVRGTIQPGQLATFSVDVTNEGPSDAPGFSFDLRASHLVSSISDNNSSNKKDFEACTSSQSSNVSSITCSKDILKVGENFSIVVSLQTRSVSTAQLIGTAASKNARLNIASDNASIKVGDFKNGTLYIDPVLYLLILLFMIYRHQRFVVLSRQ